MAWTKAVVFRRSSMLFYVWYGLLGKVIRFSVCVCVRACVRVCVRERENERERELELFFRSCSKGHC